MRQLAVVVAWMIAACAGSADAGDLPPHRTVELPSPCVPSPDDTLWLPAAGAAVASDSRAAAYGKSCGAARDERWIAELVDGGSASFVARARSGDATARAKPKARVELAVYGWMAPRWIDREYLPGHWQLLGEARGAEAASVRVDAADDVTPYSLVRIAARAADGADAQLPVAVVVAR